MHQFMKPANVYNPYEAGHGPPQSPNSPRPKKHIIAAPNTLPLPMPVTMPPMMIIQNAREGIDFVCISLASNALKFKAFRPKPMLLEGVHGCNEISTDQFAAARASRSRGLNSSMRARLAAAPASPCARCNVHSARHASTDQGLIPKILRRNSSRVSPRSDAASMFVSKRSDTAYRIQRSCGSASKANP